MQLHYTPGTIAIAAAIALEEANLPYEPIRVDFKTAEQTKPAYHAINPKGRVPALVLETGDILTETGAILDFIAASAPQAGLVPTDLIAAGKMRSAMYYFASTMHVNHAHKMRGSRWATAQSSFDDMAAMVPQTMTQGAAFVQENMALSPFVLGVEFSLADPYLFVICTWLAGDGVDLAAFPKITAFMAQMESRPSVKTIREKGML
ncbi:MAG: glutathione S-transferase family protein [Sulfitobacter sp.]